MSTNFFLVVRFLLRIIFILSLLLSVQAVSFLALRQTNGRLKFAHIFCKTIVYREKRAWSQQWETAVLCVNSQKSETLIRLSDRHYLVFLINTLSNNLSILKKISVFSKFYCASRNNAFNSPIPCCLHQYYREM